AAGEVGLGQRDAGDVADVVVAIVEAAIELAVGTVVLVDAGGPALIVVLERHLHGRALDGLLDRGLGDAAILLLELDLGLRGIERVTGGDAGEGGQREQRDLVLAVLAGALIGPRGGGDVLAGLPGLIMIAGGDHRVGGLVAGLVDGDLVRLAVL